MRRPSLRTTAAIMAFAAIGVAAPAMAYAYVNGGEPTNGFGQASGSSTDGTTPGTTAAPSPTTTPDATPVPSTEAPTPPSTTAPATGSTPDPKADDAARQAYDACLKEHGATPPMHPTPAPPPNGQADPGAGTGAPPAGPPPQATPPQLDDATKAALEACKDLRPEPRRPQRPALSAEDQAKIEAFRACMKEHGVEVPAEPSTGGPPATAPTPPDPATAKAAHDACKDKLPFPDGGPGAGHVLGGPGGPGGPRGPGCPPGQGPGQQGQGPGQPGQGHPGGPPPAPGQGQPGQGQPGAPPTTTPGTTPGTTPASS